jgi:hypothetical protein
MQYSPKLKRVMSDIKKMLDENDIAGIVVLSEYGFGEFLVKVNTQDSIANIQNNELRLKTSLKNCDGNKQLLEKKIIYTANMLSILSDITARIALTLIEASEKLDKISQANHTSEGFVSQTDLDN